METMDLLSKLKNDKRFYKKMAGESGLMGTLFSSRKNFLKGVNHSLHSAVLLSFYKPEEEDTDTGFGEYGIFAVPLNETGRRELDEIQQLLKVKGLLEDIGNLRFESRGTGYTMLDLPDYQINEPEAALLRGHSTENLLIYPLSVVYPKKSGGIKEFDKFLYCRHIDGKRWVMPLISSRFLSEN